MFDSALQLLHTLYDVQGLIAWGGLVLICAIVFIETGLFVGFFLPGDSLLVTAGIFAAAGILELGTLLPSVILCGIIGDQVGYWIGQRAGQALYSRQDSFFFRRKHLEHARRFYEEYGGMTIILARFVPVVRTFCPPVAGAAGMRYAKFLTYNIVGGTVWGGGMILAGYFLGSLVPNIGEHIHYVIVVVVILSLIPAVVGILRARKTPATSDPLPLTPSEPE